MTKHVKPAAPELDPATPQAVQNIYLFSRRVKDGDPTDKYLAETRGVTRRPLPDSVRHRIHKRYAAGEMVVLARSLSTNGVTALQRTPLAHATNETGVRARFQAQRDEDGHKKCKSVGRIGDALIAFQGNSTATVVVTEGVEDALSVWQACDRTVAAATGVHMIGKVGRAFVPDGEIIVAADNDPPDSPAALQLKRSIGVLQQGGLRVLVARPPADIHDMNELLLKQGDDAVRAAIDGAVAAEDMRAHEQPDWPDGVNEDSGRPLPGYGNTLAALERIDGITFWHDEFRNKDFVDGLPITGRNGEMSDKADSLIRDAVYGQYGFHPRTEQLKHALNVIGERNARNPPVAWLNALPPHDGVPRLATWFHIYYGSDDTPLNTAYGTKFFFGLVQRTLTPGSKFDHELHMQGRQGVRKSMAIEDLAIEPDLYTNAGEVGSSMKELREAIEGKQIVEQPEGAGHSRADRDRAKAMVTRPRLRARMAYDRYASEHARTSVTIRSLNEGGYLNDPTGERRYWNFVFRKYDREAFLRDKEQLYAEALALVRAGTEKPWLDTPELQAMHDAHVAGLKEPNEYAELLADLKGYVWPDGTERVSNEAVTAFLFGPEATKDRTLRIPNYRRHVDEGMAEGGWTKSKRTMQIVPGATGSKLRGYWRRTTEPPTEPPPEEVF